MPSEPLCPICQSTDFDDWHDGTVVCLGCGARAPVAVFARLADAVALAAAVEAIDQEIEAHQGRSMMFWYIPVRGADDAVRYRPELFMSNNRYVHDLGLAAALRALAGEGENHA
jgi:hypothetical protein